MNKTSLRWGLTLALAGAGLGAEDKPVAPPPEQAQLLGQWKLDVEKSDNVHEKMRVQREASGPEGRGPGGGARMGGGRRPGAGAMGGGGDFRQQMEARRALMEEIADPARVLTIVSAAGELTLTADDGRIRRLRPDGNAVKGEGGLERKAHWEAGHLLVETKIGALKMTEAWTLAPEEPRLHVSTRLENPRGEPLVILSLIHI